MKVGYKLTNNNVSYRLKSNVDRVSIYARQLYILAALCLTIAFANAQDTAASKNGLDTIRKTTTKTSTHIAVDNRGRPLDTDGDGVPDYRDMEILTSSRCFPVDTLGRGICPEPWCCQWETPIIERFDCRFGSVSIKFPRASYLLDGKAKEVLDSVGLSLKNNPNCLMTIGTIARTGKINVTLSWKRLKATMNYLVVKFGISQERFAFGYDIGELDEVELAGRNYGEQPAPKRRSK